MLEFRASVVIGAGSLSFEMIRSLTERLPIMITPRWVNVPAQPIAIDDVLEYLVAALDASGFDNLACTRSAARTRSPTPTSCVSTRASVACDRRMISRAASSRHTSPASGSDWSPRSTRASGAS